MLNTSELQNIIPFLVLGGGIVVSLVIEMFSSKSKMILPWFSILLFAFVAVYSVLNVYSHDLLFGGMLFVGGKSAFFNFMFSLGAALMVLNSVDYVKKYGSNYGVFSILVQSAVLGMIVMAGARDLLMIFLGVELMANCFYILAGVYIRKSNAS